MMIRTIAEERSKNVAVMDVFSKLIQDRIIFIDDEIDDELANGVIAQMLYLNSMNKKETIHIYINSPGGSVVAGLAIYDISKIIEAPIRTVCIGMAASMGAVLMLMGQERCSLRHSRLMFHEISGGSIGKLSDMRIDFKLTESIQEDLYKVIRENTTFDNIDELFKKDLWLKPEEAMKYNVINKIL